MANFSPTDYGKIGLGYANWQSMIGMSDKTPFGFADDQNENKVAPVEPPTKIDATVAPPDYSVPPMSMPSTFGVAPKATFGLPPLPNISMQPMSLEDSIKKSFED